MLLAALQIEIAINVLQVKFELIDSPVFTLFDQVKVVAADKDTRILLDKTSLVFRW